MLKKKTYSFYNIDICPMMPVLEENSLNSKKKVLLSYTKIKKKLNFHRQLSIKIINTFS